MTQDQNSTFIESIRLQNVDGTINLPIAYFDSGGNLIIGGTTLTEGDFANGTAANPSISFNSDPTTGFFRYAASVIGVAAGGANRIIFGDTSIQVASTSTISWSSGADPGAAQDVVLTRDAAAVLAIKNSTTAQTFRVYGTITGPKYLSLGHDGTNAVIGTNSTQGLVFQINATSYWNITTGAALAPVNDNQVDIGTTTKRAGNIYGVLGTFGLATNAATTGGNVYIGADAASVLNVDTASTAAISGVMQFLKSNGTQAARTIVASGDQLGALKALGTAVAGTFQVAAQIVFKVDGTPGAGTDMPGRIEFYTTPDGSATPGLALTIDSTGALNVGAGGGRLNLHTTAYGVGTAYALTNTAAAIDLGTTDPAIVLTKAGTYLISGQVNLAYTGATVVAETATIKVRRTNNTAADLSALVVLDLPVATTLTNTYGIFNIPPFIYTTTATDDAITLFANVSAALSAGTIDATAIGTSIIAQRLY